jgi:hypothetical protein
LADSDHSLALSVAQQALPNRVPTQLNCYRTRAPEGDAARQTCIARDMTDSLLFKDRAVGAQNAFCRIVFSQFIFEL